jgi:hypothetical protein
MTSNPGNFLEKRYNWQRFGFRRTRISGGSKKKIIEKRKAIESFCTATLFPEYGIDEEH